MELDETYTHEFVEKKVGCFADSYGHPYVICKVGNRIVKDLSVSMSDSLTYNICAVPCTYNN